MAFVQNPVIGRASKQAGGMVFSTLDGKNVMRAKPFSYRDANTLVQQCNRLAFSITSKWVWQLKLSYGLIGALRKGGGSYNKAGAALATSVKSQFTPDPDGLNPEVAFAASGCVFGDNSLSRVVIDSADSVAGRQIDVAWDETQSRQSGAATDLLMVVVFNRTQMTSVALQTTEAFSTGSASVVIPKWMEVGDEIFVFCAFTAADFTASSEFYCLSDMSQLIIT